MICHARNLYRRPHPPAEGEQLSTLAAVVLAVTVALAPGTPTTNAQIIHAAAVSPWPEFSACVEHRESRGVPTARSAVSSSQGLFQFLDSQWRHGLPYMVKDRLVAFGMDKQAAREWRVRLQRTPIWRWPARMQRIGHAEVLDRGGWRHWWLAGSRCNALVGR